MDSNGKLVVIGTAFVIVVALFFSQIGGYILNLIPLEYRNIIAIVMLIVLSLCFLYVYLKGKTGSSDTEETVEE